MNRNAREMNSGRMQRIIASTGAVLLLVGAIIAIGLAANSANAAWDSSAAGGIVAKKKNQVAVTETVTVTVTITGTAQSTATRTPNVEQTRTPRPTGTVSKVSLCHRTGSQTNPYVLISISTSALPAHQQHGDIYPVPQGGCPQATPRATRTPRATNTARPATATVQANKGNGNSNGNGNGNSNANAGNNGNANPGANDNNGNANPGANDNNGKDKGNNGNGNGNKGKP
jgi:hypothetical protein